MPVTRTRQWRDSAHRNFLAMFQRDSLGLTDLTLAYPPETTLSVTAVGVLVISKRPPGLAFLRKTDGPRNKTRTVRRASSLAGHQAGVSVERHDCKPGWFRSAANGRRRNPESKCERHSGNRFAWLHARRKSSGSALATTSQHVHALARRDTLRWNHRAII